MSMQLPIYLDMLHDAEHSLADSFRRVADGHAADADVYYLSHTFATQCDAHVERLAPLVNRYGERRREEPERLHAEGLTEARSGPLGLIRDLQELYTLVSFVDITWVLVEQAGEAVRDREMIEAVVACDHETSEQLAWLRTRIGQAAPQALVVG